ncbi:PTS lactose/cellobiose transporter subunit IIA [Erysipelotrichaceae bacterium HCN-30851]
MNDSPIDLIAMNIIANSGDARSHAFAALEEAKQGNFETAEEFLKKANDAVNLAHKAQTELLFEEANGNKQDVNVLLIHSQDHLMTCMLAIELIKEMIVMYKSKS